MTNYKTLHKVDFLIAATNKATIHQLTEIRNLQDVTILHYEETPLTETMNVKNLINLSMVIAVDDYGDGNSDVSLFLDTIFANAYLEVISYDEQQIQVGDNEA